jgi:serine/threonine-protein kinase HipA
MKNPKEITELKIARNGIYAGILKRTTRGCEFEFVREFFQQQEFDGIAFSMKKNKLTWENYGVNLFPFFAGLLPEGLRFKNLVRNLKTGEDDLFSILAAIGQNVIGDVYVTSENSISEWAAPRLKEINFYDYFQQTITSNKIFHDYSLAGVQNKISASMISFPLNIAKENAMYILKLNPADKANLVQNEYHCLELARKCGLKTEKAKIVKDKDDNPGLLVTRFDRTWSAKKQCFLMHHQEDACQLLDRYPADKYRISFNDIVKGIEKHVSAAKPAILKLLQLYAFSYLAGNGDLHAKNISLLVKAGNNMAEISPVYDIVCTRIYGDHNMAIKLDGRDDNLKRKNFINFGELFGIPQTATGKMLDKLLQRFERHNAILYNIPMTDKQKKLLKKAIEKRFADLS